MNPSLRASLFGLGLIVGVPMVSAQEVRVPVSSRPDNAPCPPGVYLITDVDAVSSSQPIAENFIDRHKLGNLLGGMLAAGLSSFKIKAVLEGGQAVVRTRTPKPTFKFCFPAEAGSPQTNSGAGSAYVGAARTALSPKEYALVRFDANKDDRSLSVAKVKTGGILGDIPDAMINFSVTKEGANVFYVTPDKALVAGEYGFFHSTGSASVPAKRKAKVHERVYDFGID